MNVNDTRTNINNNNNNNDISIIKLIFTNNDVQNKTPVQK
jgi:hypothetical protein